MSLPERPHLERELVVRSCLLSDFVVDRTGALTALHRKGPISKSWVVPWLGFPMPISQAHGCADICLTPSQDEQSSRSLVLEKRSPEMPSFGGLSSGLPRKGGGAAMVQAPQLPDAPQLTEQAQSTILNSNSRILCQEGQQRGFSSGSEMSMLSSCKVKLCENGKV